MQTRQSATSPQSASAMPVHWPSKPIHVPVFRLIDASESSPAPSHALSGPPHALPIFARIFAAAALCAPAAADAHCARLAGFPLAITPFLHLSTTFAEAATYLPYSFAIARAHFTG